MKKILFLDYNPPWQSTKGFFITKEKSPIWYEATKQNFFLKNIRQYKKVSFSRFPCVPCGSISKSAESYSYLSVVSMSNRVVSTRYFLLFDSLDFIGAIHSCNFANNYFLDWCLSCLHACSKSTAKTPTQTKTKKSKIHLVSFMVTILIFCPSTYSLMWYIYHTKNQKKQYYIIDQWESTCQSWILLAGYHRSSNFYFLFFWLVFFHWIKTIKHFLLSVKNNCWC